MGHIDPRGSSHWREISAVTERWTQPARDAEQLADGLVEPVRLAPTARARHGGHCPSRCITVGRTQLGIARPTEITMSPLNTGSPELAPIAEVPRRAGHSRSQVVLGCIGLALLTIGAFSATATARKEWTPPVELSVTHGSAGQPVAEVDFGSKGPITARLEVVTEGRILWSSPLSRNAATQNVVLPAGLLDPQSRVLLVSSGQTLREVDG